jgi:hypothetical protein
LLQSLPLARVRGRYSELTGKDCQSGIVSCDYRDFERVDGSANTKVTWFEVWSRYLALQVSAHFRDMLHTQYRSSARPRPPSKESQPETKPGNCKQLDGQQLVDSTGTWKSPQSRRRSGSSTDSLGFDSSQEVASLMMYFRTGFLQWTQRSVT